MKALIIDDEIDICYLLSGILKQKNFQTNYVNNLANAAIELKNSAPVIVFFRQSFTRWIRDRFCRLYKNKLPYYKDCDDNSV